MLAFHRSPVLALVIATGLLNSASVPAAVSPVSPAPPRNIAVFNLNAFPDMVFILYPVKTSRGWGPSSEKPVRLDATAAGGGPGVQLPSDLPVGELALLAVPRKLAEKSKEPLDLAWLESSAHGVIHVEGTIRTYPVERHSALHRYQVDKTEKGLKLTLLNPDVLKPYPAERIGETVAEKPPRNYYWLLLAPGALLLAGCVWTLWRLQRRNPPASASAQ